MKTGADFIFVGSGAVELATRKANGMVRFCEGWVWNERLLTEVSEKRKGYGKCDNPSGSRPNFFGDSTSPLTRGGKNVVRSEGEASNPSGSRPNFFGRQHLTFDNGGKGVGVGQGLVGDLSVVDILHCNRKKSGTVPYPINLNR